MSKSWRNWWRALTPEQYQRCASGLQEAGLALAELRQVQHVRSEVLQVLKRTLRDLDRAEERARNALRLLRAGE